jgi:hypothetical protein
MRKQGVIFTIIYNNVEYEIQPYEHGSRELFQVIVDGKKLFVTKTEDINGKELWTSVPQGEQKLAAALGTLIEDKKKDKQQTLF